MVTATRDLLGSAWDVRILSFVIGCLGSWYIPNGDYLSQLAFSSDYIEQLAFDCAKSAVKSSAAVWKKFIGAIEAVQDNGPNYDDDPSDAELNDIVNQQLFVEDNHDNPDPDETANLAEDFAHLFDSPRTTDFFNTTTLQLPEYIDVSDDD